MKVWDSRDKAEEFRIDLGDNEPNETHVYIIKRDGKPVATVHMRWHKSLTAEGMGNWDLSEQAWFFQKLTGLPRHVFRTREGGPTLRLENYATVKVDGSAEASRRLR